MRTKTFLGTTKNSKTCFWSFCSWWPYIWIFKLMVGQKLWQTLFKEVNKLYNLKAGELRDRIAPLEFVFLLIPVLELTFIYCYRSSISCFLYKPMIKSIVSIWLTFISGMSSNGYPYDLSWISTTLYEVIAESFD